ncbi:Tol-Pal system protein TolB [Candidatus Liberibacter africanus]|uniref:Translocation protein TolB n=1 Tax=Candidatus Liberibacter africanus PTSAPSY TaxID=1277257 RepID=A0A0G3I386_LIBAF|nr:Tol-Pal system beta propeller repeat protein TolB [Candidatus Liberibacter africanus]AKK20354.1 translocation protein TolB [Candidatus Liberibacter africanus PTSAPSY]QTP64097.1 Tol-Pal system protein TolB [Candidatus Liberibacter africanus]
MKINLCLLLVLLVGCFATPAHALVRVNTNISDYSPASIAVTKFVSVDDLGGKLSEIITKDLQGSDVFNLISQSSFKQKITNPDSVLRFQDWQSIDAQVVITGRVIKEGKDRLRTEFRLWDIKDRKQIIGRKFFSSPANWRKIAHVIADEIYQNITGEKSDFNTRVLFVSEDIVRGTIKDSLCVMDRDGANVRYLMPKKDQILLSPHFSPKLQKVAYTSYDDEDILKVYLMDVRIDRAHKRIGNFRGMVLSPSFFPKGNRMIVSVQKEGAIDIYSVDLYSNAAKRLTNTLFVNISASASPDSAQIVFESDMSGTQQIYVMQSDGSNQQRISQDGEASYFDPSWSPRGDLIAFTKFHQGKFAIGVMKKDGSQERILVEDSNLQYPTWSPSGRSLMFSRKKNDDIGAKLYSIDLNGRNEILINTPKYALDPHWVASAD